MPVTPILLLDSLGHALERVEPDDPKAAGPDSSRCPIHARQGCTDIHAELEVHRARIGRVLAQMAQRGLHGMLQLSLWNQREALHVADPQLNPTELKSHPRGQMVRDPAGDPVETKRMQ
jgi:hypothetical protein